MTTAALAILCALALAAFAAGLVVGWRDPCDGVIETPEDWGDAR